MQLASRFGHVNQIRRERPLTREELMYHVPSIFGEDRHTSRSERYAYIPTITVLENLQREGFQPFFACQTRVRDQSRREYTKHMLRLRRAGQITGQHVPEIILLNSHDGSSSYQMLPGYFRAICTNGLVCGQSLGEVRVPHRGNVVDRVIEGAYEVVGVFDLIEEKRDAMQSLVLPPPARQALAQAALTYRYGDEHQPVTTTDILTPRRREDYGKDLWSAYQTIQENMLKGGISGRSARGKRIHTAHITEKDNAWLYSLSHQTSDFGESEWIHFTGSGYLLRTDAWSYPVLRLKRLGLSKTFRRLVITLTRRYGVSLIHLDASAECLPGLPTFNW